MKQLLVTLAIVLVSSLAMAQTTTENYVKSTVYKEATTTGTVSSDHNKIETVQYFDGLGRPLQSIAVRAGGANQDVVTHIDYDGFGRQDKDWLPYVINSTGGQYQSGAENATKSYYYNATRFDADFTGLNQSTINPYSQKQLENSPLSRVQKQAAPGKDWKLGEGHEIEFAYAANTSSDNVRLFEVDITISTVNNIKVFTPVLGLSTTNNGYYAAGELYKSITKDENHSGSSKLHTTEEFKDTQGRVLLKRTYALVSNIETAHDTYYVYDDYGNLSYVIPPKVDVSNGVDATELSELCYQYEYDHRNRLVEKKIPGKGWEYIVYDKLDRPIMTKSGSINWLFTKYDVFGRVAYTGQTGIPPFASREALQNGANNHATVSEDRTEETSIYGVLINYSNDSYPNNIGQIFTINYYDDYDFDLAGGNSEASYGITPETNVKGLATGSIVRVLGTSSWISTVTYYDEKSRPIYVYSKNDYLSTTDKVKTQLDFVGNVMESTSVHKKTGHSDITTKDFYTYDHMNRLLTHEQEINGAKKEVIVRNEYDELGQLIKKRVGGDIPITSEYHKNYGLYITGNNIIKTSPVSVTAGLSTLENIPNNGYVSFKTTYDYYDLTVGLSYTDPNRFANSIIYGINLGSAGKAQVYESGTPKGSQIDYEAGDSFRVERKDNRVYYSKNGEVFYISSILTSNSPMIGDTAFTSYNGTIENFIIVNTDVALQDVDYAYNIRGWLKEINNPVSLGSDLFGFNIKYNEGNDALYNGNISSTQWKTANTDNSLKNYNYTYDALNRITSGIANNSHYNLDLVEYDKNGNIERLKRQGHTNIAGTTFGEMDNLEYFYTGNQLKAVNDYSSASATTGFVDGVELGVEYEYDDNGNMITDRNKGIPTNGITYNHLNLPTEITFDDPQYDSAKITYIYDATGVKLRKEVFQRTNTNSTMVRTSYAGNYIYKLTESCSGLDGDNVQCLSFFGDKLQFMNHPEGYVEPNAGGSFDYVYQYKDHLGNVRLSYKGENDLVYYDDFESASGWDNSGSMSGWGWPMSAFDSNIKFNGSYSGLLEPFGNSSERATHSNDWITINNSSATDYIISAWVYLENVSGNSAEMYLLMSTASETGYATSVEKTNKVYTRGKWVYFEKQISVPANMSRINLRLDNNGAGKVWYDNVSIRKAETSPDLEILEENNYYPFGLKHKGYNNNPISSNIALKKKFAGEEFEDELGKNTVAFQWRDYDPAIARFNKIDRYAEKYLDISPYSYTANNPIRFREIKGDSLNVYDLELFGNGVEEFETEISGNLGFLYDTTVDENGNVTVARNSNEGTLTKKQKSFLQLLNNVIGNAKTTTFGVLGSNSSDSDKVPIADNGGRDGSVPGHGVSFMPGVHVLDLGDISQFPSIGNGISSSGGVLAHELQEGFQMQVQGRSAQRAHIAGFAAQGLVDGYTFGSATLTGTSLNIPVSNSSGALPSITATMNNNDITNIRNNRNPITPVPSISRGVSISPVNINSGL